MHVECGRAVLANLTSNRAFAIITFLASMKARARLYQKYVSVFPCLYVKISSICFQGLQFGLRIQKSSFCMYVFIVYV